MAVSGRILATVMHFELEQNVDFLTKISDFFGTWPTPWSSEASSFQIRLAIWRHESRALIRESCGKIPRDQTNSQMSRNSRFHTQKSKNDVSRDLGRTPRYRYYSSANRSTSHMNIGDRGDPVFFGHVGGRLRAYFGHGDAF